MVRTTLCRRGVIASVCAAALASHALIVSAQAVDSFDPGADATVFSIATQADGQVIVGGSFFAIGGGGFGTVSRPSIARIDVNGSVDPGFNPGTNGQVFAVAVQADGKILIGGDFTTLGCCGPGMLTRNHIGRVATTGAWDLSFDPGANGNITAILLQPDGKIVVAGDFTMLGGGGTGTTPRNHIGRLNADGSLDTGFDPGSNGSIFGLGLQQDGNIVVGGLFSTLGGGGTGTTTRHNIGRLNADGSLDASFDPGANGEVATIALQRDGKILVGGAFTGVGGGIGATTRNHVARLNADGTVDAAFDPGANDAVVSIALQTDAKIIAGGLFTSLGGGGTGTTIRNRIGRLNADGSIDPSFDPGANDAVVAVALQPDGKIVAGGLFTTLGGGGTGTATRNHIGRLTNTDSATQILSLNGDASVITWTRTGTGPEVWRTTFESSMDGTAYTLLGSGTRIANGWQLSGQSLPLNQNVVIRARGYYATGYLNGSGSIDESIATLSVAAVPTVTTGAATAVGLTTATLNGVANPNGLSATGSFEYGTTTSYGSTTVGQSLGSGNAAVAIGGGGLTSLACGTQYHYRAKATNASGTGTGADATFTTAACPAPTVVTSAASSITTTGATLNGTVNPSGFPTTAQFDYGLTTSYGSHAAASPAPGSGSAPVAVSAVISGLSCNTSYHFRLTATNGTASNGSDLTFATAACPAPTVATLAATAITTTGATLNGTVNPNGSSTTARFDYGLTTAYGSQAVASPVPGSGSSPVAVAAAISGLVCNTQYHFRVVGINASTTNGSDLTFTTSACPPTAVTLAATSITGSGATLNGTVNPNGSSTTARFDYGLTASYGLQATATPVPGSGISPVAVSAVITGLNCNAAYHFRVVGINSSTTNGGDLTFTTGACPTPTVMSISPAFGLQAGGTSVTIGGANFKPGATVTIGGVAATNVVIVNDTTITATTPAHAAGLVNVAVINSGPQPGTLANGYSYSTGLAPTITGIAPATGSAAGGLTTTITGTNFLVGATVSFGGASGPVTLTSATSMTVTTPAHAAGTVDVVLANPDLQTVTRTGGFTFTAITSTGGGGGTTTSAPASPPPPELLPPVNLVSGVSGSTVTLSWTAAATGATPTTYVIEAGSYSGGSDQAVISTNNVATTFVADQVSPGTYFVRVRAGNGAATSGPSNEALVVVGNGGPSQTGIPGTPGRLATSASGSTVSLAWTPPVTGGAPDAYLIEAGSAPGLSDLASFSTGTAATSLSVGNVPAGTYYVRVRGQNAVGTGAPSNEVTLVVGATVCTSPAGTPAGLTAAVVGSTVTLNWSPSAGSPTSYVIAAGSSPGGVDIAVIDTGSPATTLSATVSSGVYFVRVAGKNACGTSAPSNEAIIQVP